MATPTSARMSASSSESQVAASIRPERSAETAPLNSPRTPPRRLRYEGGRLDRLGRQLRRRLDRLGVAPVDRGRWRRRRRRRGRAAVAVRAAAVGGRVGGAQPAAAAAAPSAAAAGERVATIPSDDHRQDGDRRRR